MNINSNLTLQGSTALRTLALGDFPAGGSIGAAAGTVDVFSAISIAQTTGGNQTLTLPTPTVTGFTDPIWVSNSGSAGFYINGTLFSPGQVTPVVFNGTAYVPIAASTAGLSGPYSQTFNATSDWGSPSGGLYTIVISGGTHGFGSGVKNIVVYSTNAGFNSITTADATFYDTGSGDVSIQVSDVPDGRFAGTVVISGELAAGGGGVNTVGTINSQPKSANGAVISGNTLTLQNADATHGGLLGLSYQNTGATPTWINSNIGGVKGMGLYNPDTTDTNGISMNWETDTTGAGAQTQFGYQFFGTQVTDHNNATFSATAYWNTRVSGNQKTVWSTDTSLNIYTDFQPSFNNGINAQKNITVTSGAGFVIGNNFGGGITVPSGGAITGTNVVGTGFVQGFAWNDDMDGGAIPGLGASFVGYIGQIAGYVSGKTMDTLNTVLCGVSDGGSTAGAILTNFNCIQAAGIVGGTPLTVTNLRALYVPSIFGGFATNEYGVSVIPSVDNYFKKSITIGQASESKTTETNTAIEVGGGKDVVLDTASAVYIGAVNTDGSWRYIRSGADLLFQRRIAGTYVTKMTITG